MKPADKIFVRLAPFAFLLVSCGSDEPSSLQIELGAARQALGFENDLDEMEETLEILEMDSQGRVVPLRLRGKQAVTSGTSPNARKERAEWNAMHASGPAPNPPARERTPTEVALAHAATRAPDERVPVTIILEDPGFDFRRLGRLKQAAISVDERDLLRHELIAERQAQLFDSNQRVVLERLERLGAEVKHVFWIDDSISADVPAGSMAELTRWSEVTTVYHEDPALAPVPGSTGLKIRSEALVGAFHTAGYKADNGQNGTSARLKVAVIETSAGNQIVNSNHDGFRDTAGGTNRVAFVYDCTSGTCVTTATSGSADNHSTQVTWALAGSIEEAQDPGDYPGGPPATSGQKRSSGVATEASIQFYFANSMSQHKAALELAVANDADVVNQSSWSSLRECEDFASPESYDLSGINAALRAAMNSHVLVVQISGNGESSGDTCTASWPSWRPHVLGVGALATAGSITRDAAFLQATSGRGKVPYWYDGNQVPDTQAAVMLVAPGDIEYYFSGNSGYNTVTVGGTSYAAPIVAGSAAVLKDAFYSLGMPNWSTNVKLLLTNMLLMGNGWWVSGNNNFGVEAGSLSQYSSRTSGFGKLAMHYPFDATMGTNSKWASTVMFVDQGGDYRSLAVNPSSTGANQPLPSNVTQLKWAVTWFPDELTDAGSMGAEIFEAPCNSTTPWTGTMLARDWNGSSRIRLQLLAGSLANKCIFLVVKPYYTPRGVVTSVYNAFYWHSGSTGPH